jgi:Zn-dependent peptidase ImmA (M78 family)
LRVGFCRDIARKILKEMNIKSPPVDIRKILETKGYTYFEVDTFADGLEALLIEQDGEKYAAVNKNHHETKKRFSLAHEFGHKELNHNLSYYRETPTIDNPPTSLYNSHKSAYKCPEA